MYESTATSYKERPNYKIISRLLQVVASESLPDTVIYDVAYPCKTYQTCLLLKWDIWDYPR